jgi:hypothetical protein
MWLPTAAGSRPPGAVIEPSFLFLSRSSSLSYQTLYDTSFAVTGQKLWNTVPKNIRAAVSFDSLNISLSEFFADLIPDNPPLTSYSCSWSNSVIDYTPVTWSDF